MRRGQAGEDEAEKGRFWMVEQGQKGGKQRLGVVVGGTVGGAAGKGVADARRRRAEAGRTVLRRWLWAGRGLPAFSFLHEGQFSPPLSLTCQLGNLQLQHTRGRALLHDLCTFARVGLDQASAAIAPPLLTLSMPQPRHTRQI